MHCLHTNGGAREVAHLIAFRLLVAERIGKIGIIHGPEILEHNRAGRTTKGMLKTQNSRTAGHTGLNSKEVC